MNPLTRDPPSRRTRIAAVVSALAVMAVATLLPAASSRGRAPWGVSEARADCLPGVPAPKFFSAALLTNFPAGNEFLGRVRFSYFADDFTGYFTPLPTFPTPADDRGVDGLEFEVRDVTANGEYRLLSRYPFNRFSIADYTAEVVPSEAPESPDPDLLYLGRTYTFRVRAIALGLNANGARDVAFPPTCVFPWSTESTVTTPLPVGPGINVSATAIDFGDVPLGFEARRTVTVRNGNAQAMTVRLPASKPPFLHDSATNSVVLEPNASIALELTFEPKRVGAETLPFRVTGPAGVEPVSIELTANGTPAAPRLSFAPPSWDFGKIRGRAKKTFAVTNLTGRTVRAKFGKAVPFYLRGPSTIDIAPHATAQVEFEFIPQTNETPFAASVDVTVRPRVGSPGQTLELRGEIHTTMIVRQVDGSGVPQWRLPPAPFRPLLPGQELLEGAELAAAPDSNVELEMPGGRVFNLEPTTQVTVSGFFEKGGRARVFDELIQNGGRLVSSVPEIVPQKSVPGVTSFRLTTVVDPATGDTTFLVTGGPVSVTPLARRGRTISVKDGRQVTVTTSGAGPITTYEP